MVKRIVNNDKAVSLPTHKVRIVLALVLSAASALFLVGLSYIIFPTVPNSGVLSAPVDNTVYNALWALQWMGLTVFIAFLTVGIALVVKRKLPTNKEIK